MARRLTFAKEFSSVFGACETTLGILIERLTGLVHVRRDEFGEVLCSDKSRQVSKDQEVKNLQGNLAGETSALNLLLQTYNCEYNIKHYAFSADFTIGRISPKSTANLPIENRG